MKRIVSPTLTTTLLVPVNQAIIALPHKPQVSFATTTESSTPDPDIHRHQDTLDTVHVSEAKVKNNVERFVKAHTLAVGPAFSLKRHSHPIICLSVLNSLAGRRRKASEL